MEPPVPCSRDERVFLTPTSGTIHHEPRGDVTAISMVVLPMFKVHSTVVRDPLGQSKPFRDPSHG